jgi:hypothetical protein
MGLKIKKPRGLNGALVCFTSFEDHHLKNGVVDGFKANHPITFYLTHQNSNL